MTVAKQLLTGRLARALQVVLIAEVIALALVGWLLHSRGIPAAQIAGLLLGYYLGLRALIVSKNFWSAEKHKSPRRPEHRLSLLRSLRLWWGEYWITQVTYSFLFPFERFLVPLAPSPAAPGSGTPIVLVPGFACNRGYWVFFVRALKNAGLGPVYAVSLEPLFGSIDLAARQLGAFIEEIQSTTGARKVILIGHSMGGLTIRAYLHSGGADSVANAITLGTPHHGTLIAHDVRRLGANLEQMCREDRWAATLNEHQQRACDVPITAIVSPHDNIVFPQDSAELRYPNARNVHLPGIGHLEMIASRVVMRVVIEELRAENVSFADAPGRRAAVS